MVLYSLDFFNEQLFKNTSYVLPNNVINGIHDLHMFMGVTKDFEQNTYKNIRRNKNEADNWKKKEIFKATTIVKKEGIEQLLGDLKVNLNKITTVNYNAQEEKIIELIDAIIALEQDTINNDSIKQVTNIILNVSCSNKYHANLYSKLYIKLMNKYLYMCDAKDTLINKYLLEVHDIEIVDPSVDYDLFCKMTKKNEYRRTTMLFIIYLYKENVYETSKIVEIVNKMINFIKINMNNIEYVDIINEISEIINVIALNMSSEIKNNDDLKFVLNDITDFSKCKTKEHPGISNRTKFKYMDMLDQFK
jgi:hypothetical protein